MPERTAPVAKDRATHVAKELRSTCGRFFGGVRTRYMQKIAMRATNASWKMLAYCVERKPDAPSRMAFEICRIFSSPSSLLRTQFASQAENTRPPSATRATPYSMMGSGGTAPEFAAGLCMVRTWASSIRPGSPPSRLLRKPCPPGALFWPELASMTVPKMMTPTSTSAMRSHEKTVVFLKDLYHMSKVLIICWWSVRSLS
mmetsp:Transcript_3162/g.10559  ORF Transcript_3162/g.10559 Transcript_3162/m.10559 type:complete len:201 (-) Transcript_3162:54-656(-)